MAKATGGTPPEPVLQDMGPRLRAAAQAVVDARKTLELALEHRDQLIVTAVDEGMAQGAVADAAGVARTRVIGVLVKSQPGQLLP